MAHHSSLMRHTSFMLLLLLGGGLSLFRPSRGFSLTSSQASMRSITPSTARSRRSHTLPAFDCQHEEEIGKSVGRISSSCAHLLGPINVACGICMALAVFTNITVPMPLQRAAIGWTGISLGSLMIVPNAMMSDPGTFESVVAANIGMLSSGSLAFGGLYGCLVSNKWLALLPGVISELVAVFVTPSIGLLIKTICRIFGIEASHKGNFPSVIASLLSASLTISLGFLIDHSAWYIGFLSLFLTWPILGYIMS